jgi:Kef-type K+ transport system membrane component KefB
LSRNRALRLTRPTFWLLLLAVLAPLLLAGGPGPADAQPEPHSPAATAPAQGQPAPAAAPGHGEEEGHADHSELIKQLLLALVVILIGAKLGGELFERFGQPAVLGEILFGILLGNLTLIGFDGLEFMRGQNWLLALSELGVILLLFEVGLESDFQEMRKVGASALLVAILGVIAPFALGWGVARWFLPTHSVWTHVFIGATLCATSVGIAARVLKDLGHLARPEAKIVLGAAVIDDVMGLVVLAVVSGLIQSAAGGAPVDGLGIAFIILKAVGFLFGALFLGGYISPVLFRWVGYLQVRHMLLVTALGFCFLLSRLAAEIGLAAIVGAFAAGLILDPVHYQEFTDRGEHHIEELVHPLSAFLVPVFFVVTGMSVDLRALADVGVLGFAAVLTVAAIVGKQVCSFGVREAGLNRLSVGIGMIPRGEVGLIFANIGLGLRVAAPGGGTEPVVGGGTFSAVVFMVMVTTLMTPPLLKWSLKRGAAAPAEP